MSVRGNWLMVRAGWRDDARRRSSIDALLDRGATVVGSDLTDAATLASASAGVDVVVSALQGGAARPGRCGERGRAVPHGRHAPDLLAQIRLSAEWVLRGRLVASHRAGSSRRAVKQHDVHALGDQQSGHVIGDGAERTELEAIAELALKAWPRKTSGEVR